LIKSIISFLIVLFLIKTGYSQQNVTIDASSSKKDFFISENIKINVKADIQSGFHINANKISDPDLIPTTIEIDGGDLKVSKISWPSAQKLKFSFSETELDVYEGSINVGLNLKASKNTKPGKYEVKGTFHYQACNDRACFSPKDVPFTVTVTLKEDSVKKADTTKVNNKTKDSTTQKIDTTQKGNVQDTSKNTTTTLKENKRDSSQTVASNNNQNQIANYVKEKGLFLTFLFVFFIGLTLNLTPCVYPLIPITISFFGAQAGGTTGEKKTSKGQKILTAIVYVLGMSITYSVLGLVASLTGGLFGSLLQNPIVILILVLIFVALALSMFGVYEIRIPQSIANFSGKNRSGYFGTAVMGLTVGFIAAPCIGPLVLSLLVYVGQIGNPFLGFMMFFILSLGLGFPYIFLAIFSSSINKLPRSGAWMEGVKIIFGLVMLGLALYTAQALIPPKIYDIIFPVFLILAGFYLIVIDRKAANAATYTKIKYTIAIAAIVFGGMHLHFEEKQSLAGKLEWQMLSSQSQIDESVKKAGNKPTMIDFYADWCAQCKELDKYTYIDQGIVDLSKKFNTIKVDLTKENKEITDRFKILGLPVVAFIGKNGKEIENLRVTGFLKPDEFKKIMENAASN